VAAQRDGPRHRWHPRSAQSAQFKCLWHVEGEYGNMRKLLLGMVVMSVFGLMAVTTAPQALAKTHNVATVHGKRVSVHDPTIYNSIDAPLPGNNASQSFQATQTSEFGSQIIFAGTARVLENVVVTMSSWACEFGSQAVNNVNTINNPTPGSCVTNPGATFAEPVTLNMYSVGANNAVGSLITTNTQTFNIPFRPTAEPTSFVGPSPCGDGQSWYDAASSEAQKCFHGYFTNITFNFGHVTLPNKVIYGIAYNTTTWGFHPYGNAHACDATTSCGYDGLNVGYSTSSPGEPSIGSNPNLGTNYLDGLYAGFYCDDGGPGMTDVGTFRIDGRSDTNNCWNGGGYNTGYSYQGIENGGPVLASQVSPYVIPSVQFNAVSSPAAIITSASSASVVAGRPFSFTVTTTGIPTPRITEAGRLPYGLTFTNNGNGTATIAGKALTTNRDKAYVLTLRAVNLPTGGRNRQTFTLTLTGGKA